MTARSEFLDRIRVEMRRARGLAPASVAERPAAPRQLAETIRRELAERWAEAVERFREEFERVGGVFHRVRTIDDAPGVIVQLARERQADRVITWYPVALGADLSAGLRTGGLDVTPMPPDEDDGPGGRARLRETIARADLGVTGADLAIAETGTLVLRAGAGRPTSTSLLPPCHVAVFDAGSLIESLPQVAVVLEAWHDGQVAARGRNAIAFITGPSRTADIELTLTRGVHGPREVHAIFVEVPFHG